MRGRRYVGGFRAGTVDDIDDAFVRLVTDALAEGEQVHVVVAANCPASFFSLLAETGVAVEVDETLDQQAFLVDDAGHLTST